MSLPATDNFNRADAATLGANWTDVVAGFQPVKITSNKASQAGSFNNNVAAYWNADVFTADQYSQATLASDPTAFFGTPDGRNGLGVRIGGTYYGDYTGYFCIFCDTSDRCTIYKTTAGYSTFVEVGHVSAVAAIGASDGLYRMEAVGNVISVYYAGSGTPLISVTDNDIATGSPGVCFISTGTADDWEGGNLGGGSPPPSSRFRLPLLGCG